MLVDPPGAPKYRELRADAELIDLFGVPVRIASIAHLRAMKRAAGRPVDQADLDALATIERLQRRERRREVP